MPTSIRRCLFVVPLMLLAVAVFSSPGAATAQTSTDNGPIASTALSYLGTQGGQCWTFMQQVVQQATGRTVGNDYRQGFFQAGAVEVTADQAQNGDIIQIDNDADTSPASYAPGQHTAIILDNLGGGTFNAVDSNQNWDETVRLRPNYDPYARAAAEGLQVHIYHIPGGGPGGTAYTASASASTTWAAGDTGTVQADPGCLNLRAAAGLNYAIADCLATGTPITALGSSVTLDGYAWLEVQTPSTSGWVAAMYLAPDAASPPADVASSQTGSAATAAATSYAAHVDNSPGCLNVHASASLTGTNVGCLPPGSPLTVLGAGVAADGYTWLPMSNGYVSGWVASAYVVS